LYGKAKKTNNPKYLYMIENLYWEKPLFITCEIWATLTIKEKDFIILVTSRKYTKSQIKRRLYITSDVWYWKIQKKVKNKIKNDINKVNLVAWHNDFKD
jgi:hypothetical protein